MKIDYKAFIAPVGKTVSDPLEDVNEDLFAGQPSEAEVEAALWETFGVNTADSAEAPDPFSLTTGSDIPPNTAIDPVTGEQVKLGTKYPAPKLDDIINSIGFEINNTTLNNLEKIYNHVLTKYTKQKASLIEEIESGTLPPSALKAKQSELKECETAIAGIKESLGLFPARREELNQLYIKEYEELKKLALSTYAGTSATAAEAYNTGDPAIREDIVKNIFSNADINHDGYVGEPKVNGLRISEHKEFGWIIWDPATKKIVQSFDTKSGAPLGVKFSPYDPSEAWTVAGTDSGNIIKIDKIGNEDLTVKWNGTGINGYSTQFETAFDISIPDKIAVYVDEETGKPRKTFATDLNSDIDTRLSALDFEIVDGVIKQAAPEDPKDVIQVRITRVVVTSEDKDKDGKYDHIIKFYTADNEVAASIRIKDGSNYGLALNGTNTSEPIEIDAHNMKSTVQQGILSDILNEKIYGRYGVDPSKMEGREQLAFYETMNHFTVTASQNGAAVAQTQKTGLIAYDVNGYVRGAAGANNLVLFKKPQFAIKDGESPVEDKLFVNIFQGGGDNYNAVFAEGGGDFIAQGVTLAYRENNTGYGYTAVRVNNTIGTIDNNKDSNETKDITSKNAAVYVHTTGGEEIFIDNPTDQYTDKDGKKLYDGADDDWFDTDKAGSYSNPNSITGGTTGVVADQDADTGDIGAVNDSNAEVQKTITDFLDALEKIDTSEDTLETELTIDNIGGDYYKSIKGEMETFFTDFETELDIANDGLSLDFSAFEEES